MAGKGSAPGERRGGRQKGTPNKRTAEFQAAVAASGIEPREFMLAVMRDETKELSVRMDAAKAVAPYVHSRLSAIEHTGKDGGPIEMTDANPRDLARVLASICPPVILEMIRKIDETPS